MVWFTELGLMATSLGLVANASLRHPHLWVLYAAACLASGLDGIQRPSLDAMVPRLVTKDEIPAAAALTGLRGNVGMIAGPALAGLLLAAVGLRATFLVDVGSFAASLLAVALISAVPPPPDAERPSFRGIKQGWKYAASRPELLGSYLVDLNAMFFGMPTALFPALAARLHGGAGALGLLYAAPAVGAGLANLLSGLATRVARHGLGIILAAAAWGLAIVVFGLAHALAPALVFLAVAGAADMVSGLFRMTLWNQTIPDQLRGRLAGIEMISYASGPSLGNVEAGAVAALAGVPASIVSGGVLCVMGTALIAWRLPGMRRYRATTGVVG
jgi:MFS family permease